MKKHLLYVILALFFGALFFYTQYPDRIIGLNHYDEGILVFTSENLMLGKVPYKDFYISYPPGFHMFLALVFKIFGSTLLNEKVAVLLVHTATVAFSVFYVSMAGYLFYGIAVGIIFLSISTGIHLGTVLLVVVSQILLTAFFKTEKLRFLFLNGFFLGLACFFRIDYGFYAILSTTLTLLIYNFYHIQKKQPIVRSLVIISSKIKYFFVGICTGLTPLFITAVWAGFIPTIIDLILLPRINSINRKLPFPNIVNGFIQYIIHISTTSFQQYFASVVSMWPYYFPLIISLIGLIFIYRDRNKISKNLSYYFSSLSIFISIIFNYPYMLYRADVDHTIPINMLAFIGFPFVLHMAKNQIKNKLNVVFILLVILFIIFGLWDRKYVDTLVSFTPFILIGGILAFFIRGRLFRKNDFTLLFIIIIFILNLLMFDRLKIYPQQKSKFTKSDLAKSGHIMVPDSERQYIELVKFLQKNIKPREPILSTVLFHDKFFVNDTLLYFLSDTSSVTRYWQYDPGIQSSKDIQEYMVQELILGKPRYIVVWISGSYTNEPNLSSRSSGVHIVDEYIKSNYTATKQFGDYIILEKIDQSKNKI